MATGSWLGGTCRHPTDHPPGQREHGAVVAVVDHRGVEPAMLPEELKIALLVGVYCATPLRE